MVYSKGVRITIQQLLMIAFMAVQGAFGGVFLYCGCLGISIGDISFLCGTGIFLGTFCFLFLVMLFCRILERDLD